MADDSEPATVLLCKDRKARKEHRCSECGRTIAAGETYEDQRFLSDGILGLAKTCAHCQVPRSWLAKNCGGWVYGSVLEDIREHAETYPDLAAPLSFLAQGMRGRWAHDGVLMPLPDQAPPITVAERH